MRGLTPGVYDGTDSYIDPYSGEQTYDELISGAKKTLANVTDWGGIGGSPEARNATARAARTQGISSDLESELSRIDRGGIQRTSDLDLGPDLGGQVAPALPSSRPGLLGRAYDAVTQPFAPVRRTIERGRAIGEAQRLQTEAGVENSGYDPTGDFLDELLLGQLSPANVAGAALPLAPASRATNVAQDVMRGVDLGGATVEGGRTWNALKEGRYRDAATSGVNALLMAISGALPQNRYGGVKQGEVLDDLLASPEPGTVPREAPALPGQRQLPPRPGEPSTTNPFDDEAWWRDYERSTQGDPSAARRGPGNVVDTEIVPDAQLPGGPAAPRRLPPGPERGLPARGTGPLVTPPPPASAAPREWLESLPPTGSNPPGIPPARGMSPLDELEAALSPAPPAPPAPRVRSRKPSRAQAVTMTPPRAGVYQPAESIEFGGRRITKIDVSGAEPTIEFNNGDIVPVSPDLVDALREVDPRVPTAPRQPRGMAEADVPAPGAAARPRTPDDELNDLLAELEGQTGAPRVDTAGDGVTALNASGDSEASLEALSRQSSMQRQGQQYVVLDRSGNARPLIGPEAVDYRARAGETYAIRNADGSFQVLDDRGGRIPERGRSPAPTAETPATTRATEMAGPESAERLASGARTEVDEDPIAFLERELGLAGRDMAPEDLVRAAFTDDLTGLPNRRGMDTLERRAGGGERRINAAPPLHAAVDIRNLKAANDILGYERGDALVRAVSDELKGTLRAGDIPSRFGGDEFMLALQNVADDAKPAVQAKIQAAIDRALEKFGVSQAGEFPLGGRVGLGRTRDEAMAEVNRLKTGEQGPKYRKVQGGTPATTYDSLAPNERDFLTKRLGFTREDIDTLTPADARAAGQARAESPAETRYQSSLGELERLFDAEQPGKVQRAAQLRREARTGAVPVGPGPGPAAPSSTAIARQQRLTAAVSAEPPPAVAGRKRTPSELRATQTEAVHRARDIGAAVREGNYDAAERLITEQAEKWNTARLREGAGGAGKEPPTYRNGEYLASDFGALHQMLFTPEGRQRLARMAADPHMRALVGGLVGAASGDTAEEKIDRALLGIVAGAGSSARGRQVIGQAFNNHFRNGRIMRKSPDVPNADISYWRAFVAPSTLERSAPELFAAVRDTLHDLREFKQTGPKDAAIQAHFENLSRKDIVEFIRDEAKTAGQRGQKNLAARLESTAKAVGGELTGTQRAVKSVMQHLGKEKATGRELEHAVQRTLYRTMLGYAVDSAGKNLLQPTLALLHVSPANMLRGLKAARSQAGRKLWDTLDLDLHRPAETEDELFNLGGGAPKDSGRFMRATDNWNRKWTFLSALAEEGALDDALAGNMPAAARGKAERIMRLTQGESGPLSSSPFLRGAVGGSLKPFQKYPSLMLENFMDALRGESKYSKTGMMTMAGLALGGSAFGLNLWDLLFSGGRMQAPPIVKGMLRAKDYLTGDAQIMGDLIPASLDPEDVAKSDLGTFAIGRYPLKVAKTAANLATSKDPLSDLASLVGLDTTRRAEERGTRDEAYRFANRANRDQRRQSTRTRELYDRAHRRGDTTAIDELESTLNPRQINGLRRRMSAGDLERLRSSIPVDQRDAFDREFGAALQREREAKR